MITWAYIALCGIACVGFLFLYKWIELRFGLPRSLVNVRSRLDDSIVQGALNAKEKSRSSWLEMKQAMSRTPYLMIHLAMVMRDKLRGRFSHYIDEVRGKKRIAESETPSEFINAVKEHKEVDGTGQIE